MCNVQKCFLNNVSLIFVLIVLLSAYCVYVSLVLEPLPNFSDPQLGFETRGTDLAKRSITWHNIREQLKSSGDLVENPVVPDQLPKVVPKGHHKKRKKGRNRNRNRNRDKKHNRDRDRDHDKLQHKHWSHANHKHVLEEGGFFCNNPTEDYSHFVIESVNRNSFFNFENVLNMCHFQERLLQTKHFAQICEISEPNICCPIWSLANVIVAYNQLNNCSQITNQSIVNFSSLVDVCREFFSSNFSSRNYPSICKKNFNLLHVFFNFLTVLNNKNDNEMLMFLPISFGIGTIELHQELIENDLLSYKNVKVAALDFGIKHILFDELLMKDLKLIVLGIASVSILIWVDTKSFVFTLITVMIVILSLVFAYYCYTTVFNLHFFPFMNLLAVIVSIGIGVDDAFVYHQVWSVYRKTQQNETHRQLLLRTFKHTFVLLFSTSLTTSVAFYSLYFNNITAIKCFSIFAGTTVLFNFILVVLLLPLILKISYRFNFSICMFKNKPFEFRTAFNFSPKSSLVIAVVFMLLTIISCFIIFVRPKLQLANSFDFQLFGSDDYFEKYDRLYRKKIPFMRAVMERTSQLPLIFVWGVIPQDNGDPLNPSQTGDLLFDPDFDLSSKEAQLWMYDFCEELKSQPFYDSNFFGPQLKNCILITLTNWMENRKCIDPITDEDRSPCCEIQQFPYEKSVFDTCLKKMTNDLYDTPKDFFVPNSIAGPKYFKSNHSLGSLIIEYNSNHLFSFAYQEMTNFYETVEQWFSHKLTTAPKSLAKAWFFSDFEFYDLQSLLINGTFVSISLSMIISFFLLLALTCNFFISLFAIVCITCSILFSIAILIMLGWKLNIFESIAISTAIGLSTDFSLHYSFNFCYFLRKCRKKEKALRKTLKHIIRPTIMSGLTTAAIGLFMIPSNIIIYKQIGFFLILVMFSSWIFATFFFVSLIVLFYPKDTNSDKVEDCRTFEMNDLYY